MPWIGGRRALLAAALLVTGPVLIHDRPARRRPVQTYPCALKTFWFRWEGGGSGCCRRAYCSFASSEAKT